MPQQEWGRIPKNRATRRQEAHSAAEMIKQAQGKWTEWEFRNLVGHPDAPLGLLKACLNNIYSVQFFQQETAWGIIDHLIVRRHDSKPVRSWPDMQRIKNELMGRDRIAVELYPAESDVVDQANLYHLWVLPKGFIIPFGMQKPRSFGENLAVAQEI